MPLERALSSNTLDVSCPLFDDYTRNRQVEMADSLQNVNETVRRLLRDRPEIANRDLARALGITRQAAHLHLRRLVGQGVLERLGRGRATRYRAVRTGRTWSFRRDGLDEDQVWKRVEGEEPAVHAPEALNATLHYATTELVNNAIDHSGGSEVEVDLEVLPDRIVLEVRDDGVGIFEHVRRARGLGDPMFAIQELSKGKTTSDPARHTGEGIFFVSKMADIFAAGSGGLRWCVDNRRGDHSVGSVDDRDGTCVRFEIDRNVTRMPLEVFEQYTDDFEFTRTRIVVKLFELGDCFISRSQAKRLVMGLERFREVILDFGGVREVGQGFVDEVFRVWSFDHPETRLVPVDMAGPVEFMVRRAMPKQ
ncbi:MAG: STAS-like domain-containing protein [Planctomycetota bacterium]